MDRVLEVDGHLRLALGTPVLSTSGRAGGKRAPFRVDTYAGQPAPGAFTLVTVGLCDTSIEQEILMCAWDPWRSDAFYSTLFTLADDLSQRGISLDSGMLLELDDPVAPRSRMRDLFVYAPVYFPDALQPIETASGVVPVFWAIPVTASESRYVETHGIEAFAGLLVERDPDLLDLRRASIA